MNVCQLKLLSFAFCKNINNADHGAIRVGAFQFSFSMQYKSIEYKDTIKKIVK